MSEKGPISYDDAKRMAIDEDPAVRRNLAARTDIRPEILFYLVDDPSPEVREAVAGNRKAPHLADLKLAEDADESVRSKLAVKIVEILPDLTSEEFQEVEQLAFQALSVLARDQVTHVRKVVAETLKDVAHAPPEVINHLARDAEIVVAGPILRDSSVLTDSDLLEILSEGPIKGALAAIARRHEVGGEVADAVARTGDVEAVGWLLSNQHAQIREDTLDWIVERAPDVKSWHAPLVERPNLPGSAARRIAQFVADGLLKVLMSRGDLAPEIAETLRTEVRKRLNRKVKKSEAETMRRRDEAAKKPQPKWKRVLVGARSVQDAAMNMHRHDELDASTILDALTEGHEEFVIAALSVMSEVPYEVSERIVSMRSSKGIVALAGRAGFPGKLLGQLQTKLGRIPPDQVLKAQKPDEYPLSEDEMIWQLEFFAHLVTTNR